MPKLDRYLLRDFIQSVLATLYVGRRGVWDEKQAATYEGCAELWDTLTAGAVSTTAE